MFLNILKNALDSIKKFFCNRHKVQFVALGVSIAICVAVVLVNTSKKTAVAVIYNGNLVGYVSDMEQAKTVEAAVREDARLRGTANIEFQYRETVVGKNSIKPTDSICKQAIGRTVITDPNLQMAGLYIEDTLVAVADNSTVMQSILDSLQQKYTVDGMILDGFSKEVNIADVTVKQSDELIRVATLDEFLAAGIELGVKTHRTEEYDQTVKYSTKYTYDSTKDKTYKVTTQAGVNGLKHVVATVSYVNGEKVSSETVSSTTVKEAVNAKVTIGTKNTTFQDIKDRLDALNAANDGSKVTFIFPLEIKSAGYISSYWGDGRGHKGMDFASPKNTDIYAVADGVVTISQYSSSYGYYIEIKHSDGSRTRYAHACKLLVKVGDTVKQGQHIAEVGSTGRSTGNHLHFEVLVNGTRVNPASYLAIK